MCFFIKKTHQISDINRKTIYITAKNHTFLVSRRFPFFKDLLQAAGPFHSFRRTSAYGVLGLYFGARARGRYMYVPEITFGTKSCVDRPIFLCDFEWTKTPQSVDRTLGFNNPEVSVIADLHKKACSNAWSLRKNFIKKFKLKNHQKTPKNHIRSGCEKSSKKWQKINYLHYSSVTLSNRGHNCFEEFFTGVVRKLVVLVVSVPRGVSKHHTLKLL